MGAELSAEIKAKLSAEMEAKLVDGSKVKSGF